MGSSNATLGLGHRRLAIIDLSEDANQPMHRGLGRGPDGEDLTVVFNGEIYNLVELRDELASVGYVFHTNSDTELLLAAYAHWGTDCLNRFRGMFAFALWDAPRGELLLARDPFGKKPLLYFLHDNQIAFASELSALLRHPEIRATVDAEAISFYLRYKYVPGGATLVAGVREVPPGHKAIWRDGSLSVRRYYAPPTWVAPEDRLPWRNSTVSDFRGELTEAVQLRMRSDVPLGAFLSGGIDSSAIVALMTELSGQPVKTFSVGFKEDRFSELWAARLVAERFRSDHHELEIGPSGLLESFERATRHHGAPLAEMSDIPFFLLSRLAGQTVKVVLSGEGSDELLAGYPKYWGDIYIGRAQSVMPQALLGPLCRALIPRLGYRGRRLQLMLRALAEPSFTKRQAGWFGPMSAAETRRLCPGLPNPDPEFAWDLDPGPEADQLQRALLFDKTNWMPGTQLGRSDRMSMAASVEARMPFTDVKLCSFVARLPSAALLKKRVGKQILRRAMATTLPEPVLARPKWGFKVPVHEWLRSEMRPYVHDMLLSTTARTATWCDPKALRELVAEHESAKRNRERELWSLLSLEVFLRTLP